MCFHLRKSYFRVSRVPLRVCLAPSISNILLVLNLERGGRPEPFSACLLMSVVLSPSRLRASLPSYLFCNASLAENIPVLSGRLVSYTVVNLEATQGKSQCEKWHSILKNGKRKRADFYLDSRYVWGKF